MRILATLLCGFVLGACLDTGAPNERSVGFLDDVTVLGVTDDPWLSGVTPDEVVALELLPADPDTALAPPEDAWLWPSFIGEHPEFLAASEDAPTGAWGAGAGAIGGPDAVARPTVTFDWRSFLSARGREVGAKQGVVLAHAGLIALAIPSPVPEPTDAVAGVYLAVGTAVVLVTVGVNAARDPAVRQMVAQAIEMTDARIGELATAISRAIERTLTRAPTCPPLVPIVGVARRVAGFLPAYRDEVLVCLDAQGLYVDRRGIVAPDDGALTVSVTNIGPQPIGIFGVQLAGADLSNITATPRPVSPGMRDEMTFAETITKRVLLVGSLTSPLGVAIAIE